MKQNILFLFMLAFALNGWSQATCETSSCLSTTTYYLDIDGDGFGVDNSETNLECCARPDMYADSAGDAFPFDAYRVNATLAEDSLNLVRGCTLKGACNYDSTAVWENGTCLFPFDCQTCDFATGGIAADSTGNVPCDCDELVPTTALYLDSLNTCGGGCWQDDDGDGICDLDSDGDGYNDDKCPGNPYNIIDQCGNCQLDSVSGSWFFLVSDPSEPCVPGDPGCTFGGAADAGCNCDSTIFLNNCDVCVQNDIDTTRYDCSGNCHNDDDLYYTLPNDTTQYELCNYLRIEGCMDETKCNYDPEANVSGTCFDLDECNRCGGTGIDTANGECDCDGNVKDALDVCGGTCASDANDNNICDDLEVVGCSNPIACNYDTNINVVDNTTCILKDSLDICGGTCFADLDGDKICDDIDPCVGLYDDCGNCVADVDSGSWFTLEDGTTPCEAGTEGCFLDVALNLCDCDSSTYDVLKVCGGLCTTDADGDGVCDHDLDGDGIPEDADICASVRDSLGVCGGNCWADADGDYLCDTDTNGDGLPEDPCLDDPDNNRNECGECLNDSASIVLPEGSCNCAGDTLDAIDVCGGSCTLDIDGDGICDHDLDGDSVPEDSCVGFIDDCGDCAPDSTSGSWFTLSNGTPCDPGSPGCTNADGDCDCYGRTLDSLFICGGTCFQDDDNDLICDFDGYCASGDLDGDGLCDSDTTIKALDACVGVMDDCGVCNGPGAIYDCGCAPMPEGDCDCEGNVKDICDECGGIGPAFGRNCDGTCIDLDDDGECDSDVLLDIPKVVIPQSFEVNGRIVLNRRLDHLKLMEVLDTLSMIHYRMSENLDDGSLSGHTRNLTIEKSITSRGSLYVGERARFEKMMSVDGSLSVLKKVTIAGSATIEGSTFSEGGVITTGMELTGDADVSGNFDVGNQLEINGKSAFMNGMDVANDLIGYDGLDESAEATIHVHSATGNVEALRLESTKKLEVIGETDLGHLKVDNVLTLTNARVDSQLIVEDDLELLGNLLVGNASIVDTILSINSATGNTSIGTDLDIAGDFTEDDTVHVMGDIRIKGSTFAKGGLETSNIRAGYLYVRGNANLKGELSAGNTASMHSSVDLYRNLRIREVRPSGDSLSNSADSLVFQISNATGDVRTWSGSMTAPSLRTDSAATIGRGATVGNRLYVTENAVFNSAMDVHGSASFAGNNEFEGKVRVDKGFRSTGTLSLGGGLVTDRIIVTGSAPSIGGALMVSNSSVMTSPIVDVDVNLSQGFAAVFRNTAGGDGIKLKAGVSNPDNATNFMEFTNSKGVVIGRIEAEHDGQLNENKTHENTVRELETEVVMAGIDQACAAIGLVLAGFELYKAVSDLAEEASPTTCAGLGVCVTIPIPSMIVAAASDIVGAGAAFYQAELAVADAAFSLDAAVKSKNAYNTGRDADLVNTGGRRRGITYASGAGDYAEWLPKLNPSQHFEPGQIVGVRRGHISFDTEKADHLFVVSTLPIVLGNAPEDESRFEKCAFMGQVHVQVLGRVKSGDYIVASGHNDGFGIAVSERDLTTDMLPRIVGRAWESGDNPTGNLVNISVGIDRGVATKLAEIESQVARLERVSLGLKEITNRLSSGDKPSAEALQKAGVLPTPVGDAKPNASSSDGQPIQFPVPEGTSITFFELNDQGMDLAFEEAKGKLMESEDEGILRFMEDLEANPEAKKVFLDGLQSKIRAHNRKSLREWQNWGFDTSPLQPLVTNVSSQNEQ